MMGVTVKGTPYKNQWLEVVENNYTATLINVVRVDGDWFVIIAVDGEIRTVSASKIVEWQGGV